MAGSTRGELRMWQERGSRQTAGTCRTSTHIWTGVAARQLTVRPQTQKPRMWFGVRSWDCLWHGALTKYSDSSFFFPPLFPCLCFTTGGCGRRLELVGTMAAVLQNMRRWSGVLVQGVHWPRSSERREVLRGTEGPLSVLQHAVLWQQRGWEAALSRRHNRMLEAADSCFWNN